MSIVTIKLAQETSTIAIPTHRIMVVDCSGSMSGELPKLRKQLKNKLTLMVEPNDSLSIIWFSGSGQCGVVFDDIQISSAADLSKVHTAIDRFLVPVGLTAFTPPLEKVLEVIANASGKPVSLSFMTDGYSNVGTKRDIIQACAKIAEVVDSTTFIEYGYYCQHDLLVEMAEETGGTVIQSTSFDNYVDHLDRILKGRTTGKRKVLENILAEFVVGITDDSVIIAKPISGKVTLPPNTISVAYQGTGGISTAQGSAAMVSALINKGKMNDAIDIAAEIGDVELFAALENAFSRQDYARAAQLATDFATGKKILYSTAPKSTTLKIDPNAYNVLTLLMDLAEQEGNFLNISHPDFKYTAISQKRETVPDENGFVPKFTDTAKEVKGAINALKFDEDRPNVSILVRRVGTVALPKNDYGFDTFDTFIWRNYAIVRDGIVNVDKLPVILSKASYDLLVQNKVINSATEPFKVNQTYVIDLTKMSVINRNMAAPTTAAKMFETQFELFKLKCEQKVLGNSYEKAEVSADFVAQYGQEGTEFLKKYGITPGGFGPKSVAAAEQGDAWIAKVLEIKLSSLSSVPKIDDVREAITKGKKLTPSQQCVQMALKKYDHDMTAEEAEKTHKEIIAKTRALRKEIVMTKFGVILGRNWFCDFANLEENTMEMDFGLGKMITGTALLTDKEV